MNEDSDLEVLSDYILSIKGSGVVLSPKDFEILKEWLALGVSRDELLLLLSDIIPSYFEKKSSKPLSGLNSQVLKTIKSHLSHKVDM